MNHLNLSNTDKDILNRAHVVLLRILSDENLESTNIHINRMHAACSLHGKQGECSINDNYVNSIPDSLNDVFARYRQDHPSVEFTNLKRLREAEQALKEARERCGVVQP